jgi:hypothetical protein
MTRNPHPTPRPSRASLFRAGTHVAAVRSGSALAIIDLERGTLHAASPDGADAWAVLVEVQTQGPGESDLPEAAGETRVIIAWVADYLLERCLIEPRKGGAQVQKARRAT